MPDQYKVFSGKISPEVLRRTDRNLSVLFSAIRFLNLVERRPG